jgi:lipoprotein-anchoring transpeptidase ErfK/SrfK
MRAVVRFAFAAVVVAATVASPTARVETTAVVRPLDSTIESIQPIGDEPVGVAHPVVVTFNGPVANRTSAERALRIAATPAMTGRFEW